MRMIRKLGDPVLIMSCKPITKFDSDLADLASIMMDVMYASNGVGLAANQIGILKSIFVYDDQIDHKGTICNPELVPSNIERVTDYEGCLSIPDTYHPTERFKYVKVIGEDITGTTIEVEGEDFLARIFQHETDHLNGKLYISRLPKASQAAIILGQQVMH